MKKKLIQYIMCLFVCAFAHADDTIYMPTSSTAEAGGEVSLAVHLQSNNPACGYQFDVVLPAGVSVATDAGGHAEIALSGMASNKDYVLDCAKMSDGMVRFLCYSLTNTAFTSLSGDVALVKLKIDSNCSSGTKGIVIRNIVMSTPDALTTYVSSSTISRLTVTVPAVLLGDVNGDGEVSVADIVVLVNKISNDKTNELNKLSADLNKDNVIDIADLKILVNKCLATYK